MSEVWHLLETRIRSHGVAHNAQLSQARLDLEVSCSTKVEQRLLELRMETEEGLNRMQKDMDDVIEHLEMQLEDLGSKFGSIPLRPTSELPFYGDSTHAILYCLWLRLHKSQNLRVRRYASTMGAIYLQTPWYILLLLQYCL